MKILKQERNSNTYSLEVELGFDQFEKAKDKVIFEFSREMRIPGFRKGKAPKDLVEKNIEPAALDNHAIQELITDFYPDLIEETKIDPIDYPKIEMEKFEKGSPIVFKIKIETYPEIKLGNYKELKVKRKPADVSDEEISKVLEDLKNRFAKFLPSVDSIVKKDDIVDFEIEAEADGAPVKRWPNNLEKYPVGKGYISPDFDKEIEGLKVGEEKTFKISFAPDYSVKDIAGKEISFKVKIKTALTREAAPLNDEFAKNVGNFSTLEELKNEIRKNMEYEKKEESEADFKNQLVEAASKEASFEVPESLINKEVDIMIEEFKSSLSYNNLTLENYLAGMQKSEKDFRESLKKTAETRAKGKLVLKKIAEIEGIKAEDYDIDTEVAVLAQGANQSTEEYKESLGEAGIKYLEDVIVRRKALDFLESKAQASE